MPWTTNPDFVAYDPLAAADLMTVVANLEYVNGKINEQFQLISWYPSNTLGAAPGSFETSTHKNNFKTMDFGDGAITAAQIFHELPEDYNGGTVTARFLWACQNATTNSVLFRIHARAFADGDALDQALGTVVEVVDANNANADYNISGESAALTIAGTPAAGKGVLWQVYRDPAHASDTLGQTAKLIGVIIKYTRS